MKKLLTTFTALFVAATFTVNAYAQTLVLTYDGKDHKYTGNILKLKVNNEIVKTDIPPVIISNRSLVPARAVFEKLGAKVDWDAKNRKVLVAMSDTSVELKINDVNAKVNSKTVKMDVPAKIINDRTMIPLRFVGEQLDMIVGWNPEDDMVTIEKKKQAIQNSLEGVTCQKAGGLDKVVISVKDYKDYNIFRLSSPERIVIDIPYTGVSQNKRMNVSSNVVKSFRYAQFEETTARIVLDVVAQPKYSVEENKGQLVLNLEPTTPIQNNIPSSGDTSSKTGALAVECKAKDFGDQVVLNLAGFKGYNAYRLTDSDRIVIDIPGVKIPDADEHRIDYHGRTVKAVRYANLDNNSLRIVVDTNGQPQYKINEKTGQLVLDIQSPTYKNIIYHNNGDRVYFTLGGATLTETKKISNKLNINKLYTERWDSNGRKYTITFPTSITDLGSGVMNINDKHLDSVEISQDNASQQTSITFYAKDKLFYEIIERVKNDDTAITLLKPASKRDKLVVIDPGHGGIEAGASYFGVDEKVINLDIAKRLNSLLKKKNVNTYMIREDDTYVGIIERAEIANHLNASLFLSVHNNAILKNPNYGGTMTLYYPQNSSSTGFNSMRLARIIQDALLSKLGTVDRKIIERPDLGVLNTTDMPAALAEIAFMSNKQEFDSLMTDSFKQKAAEALCDAIMQALNQVE